MAECFDFVIIGSGFGGSVSAMRLTEKGYSVLVLEKGKRYADQDFAKTNWHYWKYLWAPAIRAYGILQVSILEGVMVLHGAGVGGGSLGYANVLEVPSDETFETSAWNRNMKWGEVLRSHYEMAKKMLGVARNPKLWNADHILEQIAEEGGMGHTFRATDVGAYFGEAGVSVPDPFFGGEGPERAGCIHCGGCMVGCRYNAKNTLPKNYLYFAEKYGAKVIAESEVIDVRPSAFDDSRYEIIFEDSTSIIKSKTKVRARNVIFSAGVIGTMKLLLRLRDDKKSLPLLSARLGDMVRTNSEALLGVIARNSKVNYSEGVSISSIFNADRVTRVEPVRYPNGSSLMRFLGAPLVSDVITIPARLLRSLLWILQHPIDYLRAMALPGWAHNTTILLVMQNVDNYMKLRMGRSLLTLFRRGLVAERATDRRISARVDAGHDVAREFAKRISGAALGSITENMFNLPTTAHILGGAPIGRDSSEGVVNERFEVHNYPGLYIIDGSIMPANPGVNPSLTITALAEYAMSKIERKGNQYIGKQSMDRYFLRPYAPSDVQAVVDIINADSQKTLGCPHAVIDGVGNLRMVRYVPPSSDKVVAVNAQDKVIGYAYLADKENGIVTEVGGAVHPEDWGKGVGALLLNWAEECARDLSNTAPADVRTVLQANLFETEIEAIKLFIGSGYVKMREWVHMALEMDQPFPIAPLPEGMTLREMDLDQDWDIVGPAMDEAFADHWGAIELPEGSGEPDKEVKEEDDEEEMDDRPSDDSFSNAPGYCFIILDGNKVAGGILCNAKLVERKDTGRVGSVFVRREHRRRGIGQALMKTAFNTFWNHGVKRIILDTDSESFSESTKFYGGLGMQPYRREFLYEKEIRPGREVRRLNL